jgi:hypothetical protein
MKDFSSQRMFFWGGNLFANAEARNNRGEARIPEPVSKNPSIGVGSHLWADPIRGARYLL